MKGASKAYPFFKYALTILDTVYFLLILFVFCGFGLSKALELWLLKITSNRLLLIPFYFFIASFAYYLLNLPVNFYQSYVLEHKFNLSSQKLRGWFIDQAKSGIISYVIGLILLYSFYYILKSFPSWWWLVVSMSWIFFSLIFAKLAPIIIIPLFFKYKKYSNEGLRSRILGLAGKMQIKILDVFEIDFSRKTHKANAALTGWGKTRRVILADTLKDKYSYDEVEVILAHEFAHYKLGHIFKLIASNSIFITVFFYLASRIIPASLKAFGLFSLSELAALPVVLIYFVLFGIVMQPLQAYISRRLERNADLMALKVTGLKEAFISMMEKLSAQNLADRNPHPLIKLFFFDHPPIGERINMAKKIL